MVKAIIRFDDYSAISNTALERRILESVANANGRIVISAIPFVAGMEWKPRGPIELQPLPPEKIRLLREFLPRFVEVALHGYCHQTISRISGYAEFGDRVPFEHQLARLRDGKKFLEDQLEVPVNAFVPPWNNYGVVTLKAIREAGFLVISADGGSGPTEPGLAFVPSTCPFGQFKRAVKLAKKDAGALATVTLHEYDFKENGLKSAGIGLEEFQRALNVDSREAQWLRLSDCVDQGAWSSARAQDNQLLRAATHSRLGRLLPRGTRFVYWTSESARRKLRLLKRARLWF